MWKLKLYQHIFRHFFIRSLLINLEFFIDLLLIYCRIIHWFSENIDSELLSSSKYWHIIKKSYWLTVSPTTLSEKSLHIAKFQACGKHKFSKTLIFTSKFKFHHHQQMLSVIFLEMISLLYPFSRKCVPTTQVWITIVFLSETALSVIRHISPKDIMYSMVAAINNTVCIFGSC